MHAKLRVGSHLLQTRSALPQGGVATVAPLHENLSPLARIPHTKREMGRGLHTCSRAAQIVDGPANADRALDGCLARRGLVAR